MSLFGKSMDEWQQQYDGLEDSLLQTSDGGLRIEKGHLEIIRADYQGNPVNISLEPRYVGGNNRKSWDGWKKSFNRRKSTWPTFEMLYCYLSRLHDHKESDEIIAKYCIQKTRELLDGAIILTATKFVYAESGCTLINWEDGEENETRIGSNVGQGDYDLQSNVYNPPNWCSNLTTALCHSSAQELSDVLKHSCSEERNVTFHLPNTHGEYAIALGRAFDTDLNLYFNLPLTRPLPTLALRIKQHET